MNPGGHMTIGLAVRRRTRLGHPDIIKQDIKLYCLKLFINLSIIYKWHAQKWTNLKNISDLKTQLHPGILQASIVNSRAAPFRA